MKTNGRFILPFLIFVFMLPGCGSTVGPGRMGLQWRPLSSGLGKEPLKEGFHAHMPWNDVFVFSVQWQSFTERVDVLTRDELHIEMETSVLVRPIARELYAMQLEIGPDFYPSVVKPEFLTVARNTLSNYSLVEIPEKSHEIEIKILAGLKERIKGKHLEIDYVTISDIDFTSGVLRAIETKLVKEQEKDQKDFELEIAVRDAEIVRAKAKGEAEAQKIRAAGQAEAQGIIDKTLTPRFIQFKAFESPNAKFIYVPIGKDGLPVIVAPEAR